MCTRTYDIMYTQMYIRTFCSFEISAKRPDVISLTRAQNVCFEGKGGLKSILTSKYIPIACVAQQPQCRYHFPRPQPHPIQYKSTHTRTYTCTRTRRRICTHTQTQTTHTRTHKRTRAPHAHVHAHAYAHTYS